MLFGGMVVYVVLSPLFRPQASADEPQTADVPVPWAKWLGLAVACFAGIVLVAGLVNGEHTMRSANTRWPVWSWSEGPFPGKSADSVEPDGL
jgi:hypothetical protein